MNFDFTSLYRLLRNSHPLNVFNCFQFNWFNCFQLHAQAVNIFGHGWFVLLQNNAKKIQILGTVPEAEKRKIKFFCI